MQALSLELGDGLEFLVINPVTDAALYEKELDFRCRLLRLPLGIKELKTDRPFEEESVHLLLLDDAKEVRGCVVFHAESGTSGKLFQMAVDDNLQKRGLGRLLVRYLEAYLAQRGFRSVYCHAREYASGFYKAMGYVISSDKFYEVTVPHYVMSKNLAHSEA